MSESTSIFSLLRDITIAIETLRQARTKIADLELMIARQRATLDEMYRHELGPSHRLHDTQS